MWEPVPPGDTDNHSMGQVPVNMTSDNTEMLRVFIALNVDAAARAKLGTAQQALRSLPCRIGWVAPANLHLTLLFLGDILPESLPAVKCAVDETAADIAAFAFQLKGLGCFGPSTRPRVIWAGTELGKEQARALYERLALPLKAAGFFWDAREFAPHVTLGRVRSGQGAGRLLAALEEWRQFDFGTSPADRLLLIQSRLLPQGPEYAVLHTANLASVPKPDERPGVQAGQ